MDLVREPWAAGGREAPTLGLVVFEEDPVSAPTIERLLAPAGVETHVARLGFPPVSGDADAFATMLCEAAGSILPSAPPTVIGFACTTGAIALGRARLDAAVARPGHAIRVVTPIDAALAALDGLGARRVALVSPYGEDESSAVGEALAAAGHAVTRIGYFAAGDAHITAISADSIIAATRRCHAEAPSDALFLSCTGMRATPLIERLEAELGVLVLTSLQLLAWRAATLLGIAIAGPGRLFAAAMR